MLICTQKETEDKKKPSKQTPPFTVQYEYDFLCIIQPQLLTPKQTQKIPVAYDLGGQIHFRIFEKISILFF